MADLPIPSPQQPVIDPRTGLMNPVWFRYFQDLDRRLAALEAA